MCFDVPKDNKKLAFVFIYSVLTGKGPRLHAHNPANATIIMMYIHGIRVFINRDNSNRENTFKMQRRVVGCVSMNLPREWISSYVASKCD